MVVLGDPGGVEPLARGLKARCPTVSGLNAPGPLLWRCGGKPPRFFDRGGPASADGSPARYRTAVFRLSAGCSAFELREMTGARSRTRTWECRCVRPMPWPLGEWSESGGACGRTRTFTVRGLKPPPLPLGYTCELMLRIGAPSEIRTHTARVLSAMPPAVGLPARGAPYRLRSCVCALPKRCPAIERREPND